jgi:glycerophosphoryl diester phosphodiesterase
VKPPDLVAHRGYPRRYPENTGSGIEAALRRGTRYLEVDVQLTADGAPVLFHDPDLERVCGVPGSIHEHTLAELAGLRASEPDRFGTRFRDEPIATLAGLRTLIDSHPSVTVFVEVKPIAVERFGVLPVLEALDGPLGDRRDGWILISYVPELLDAARSRGWARRGLILETWSQRSEDRIGDLDVEHLFCNVVKLPRHGPLDTGGPALAVYDITDPERAMDLSGRGARFVETFAIGEMMDALAGEPPS